MQSEDDYKALRAALAVEVEEMRRNGWMLESRWAALLPVLTALAERETGDPKPYDLAGWAAAQIDKGKEQSKAAHELYGLGEETGRSVGAREHAAGKLLGYTGGDSFRHSPTYDNLPQEFIHHLLKVARGHDFALADVPDWRASGPDHVSRPDKETGRIPPAVDEVEDGGANDLVTASPSTPGKPAKRRRLVRVLVVGVGVGLAAVVALMLLLGESDRPVWDYGIACTPLASVDDDQHGGCGPQGSKAVFNSGINVENYGTGDERNFLRAGTVTTTLFYDGLKQIDEAPDDALFIQLYVHNNNDHVAAVGARVGIEIPPTAGTKLVVRGYVQADNAEPRVVTDRVVLTAAVPVRLVYEQGSARFGSRDLDDEDQLSDDIVTDGGVSLKYSDAGVDALPQGFEGVVTIRVNIVADGSGT